MNIRPAILSDNAQLVALARLTPMPGPVSVCVQREPDFFAALHQRGNPHVIVAEQDGTITGCVSIIEEDMLVSGIRQKVNYLCDLKVHPLWRNRKIGTMLCRAMHAYLLNSGIDLVFSTVAEGNHSVMPLFNWKSGIPNVTTVGKFYIQQVLPSPKFVPDPLYTIDSFPDENKMEEGYKTFIQQYALCNGYGPKDPLVSCAAYHKGEMAASVSLFDASAYKQNILTGTAWYIRWMVRAARTFLKTSYIPRNGEEIRLLYARRCWHLPGHEKALAELIRFARQYAYTHRYSFLTVAVHEKDRFCKTLRQFRSFPYEARGMICGLQGTGIVEKIKAGTVLHDFSII